MANYRVLGGQKPFAGYPPGTLLELTDTEAHGFPDKLEPVAPETSPPATSPPAGETERRGKRRR